MSKANEIYDNLLDRESKEPMVWRVGVRYFDVSYKDEDNPSGQNNYSSWPYFPSCKTKEEIEEAFYHLFIQSLFKKDKPIPTVWHVNAEPLGNYRWWLRWFCHETNQYFKTEQEAFEDFRNFVDETRLYQWEDFGSSDRRPNNKLPWCPMGAGDRWRWKFCGCEKCKEQQITVIEH